MQELVEYIAKSLVDKPEEVEVTMQQEGNLVLLELKVAPDDTGRIIGKDGRVANSIRALLRSVAARDGQRVTIKIL
jgi:hypothetical protein